MITNVFEPVKRLIVGMGAFGISAAAVYGVVAGVGTVCEVSGNIVKVVAEKKKGSV